MCKAPNLIIAGAQKAGSTWLHQRLNFHPQVFMSEVKELNFFTQADSATNEKKWEQYLEHFQAADKEKIIGETTPIYFWTYDKKTNYIDNTYFSNKNVIASLKKRLHRDLKVIITLRNPVARAVSAYMHHFRKGRFDGGESIFEAGKSYGIIDMGFYKRHLLEWLKKISLDNIFIVFFDDIKSRPAYVLNNLSRFLKIDDYDFSKHKQIKKASNTGLSLQLLDGNLTVGDDELGLLEQQLKKGIQKPVITANDIKKLYNLYHHDIFFVNTVFARGTLNWTSNHGLDYFI